MFIDILSQIRIYVPNFFDPRCILGPYTNRSYDIAHNAQTIGAKYREKIFKQIEEYQNIYIILLHI